MLPAFLPASPREAWLLQHIFSFHNPTEEAGGQLSSPALPRGGRAAPAQIICSHTNRRSEGQLPTNFFKEISTHFKLFQTPSSDSMSCRTMEPQCFSLSLTPPETCGPPPNLRNGFIQNPKDLYMVGSTVDFSCIEGYYLSGHAAARCTEDKTWTQGTWVCIRSMCRYPQLSGDVLGTPTKVSYGIGETVSLHCPAGSLLDGEVSEVMCTPSLQWSPSPAGVSCKAAPTAPTPPPGLKCKPWEKVGTTECVCKMPSECSTSLLLCAGLVSTQTPRLLSLCQLGALRCIGRSFVLNTDTDCRWPPPIFTSYGDCLPGTVCHSSARECVCLNVSDCPRDSPPLCVSSAVATTMTECEVGARRCAGERFNVTGIDSCPS
ncbi:unnamed protein product [Pleuronectes platessa]|uniref:Sushi domain-containing protein n=1 Tax=Pleuronectes platessa TaxID=8262 RepID=A0A9N7ZA57_PLEPL|nr:unnamed protein product [Pleuronectes platessa]